MSSVDQLQDLWASQPLCAQSKGEDIMKMAERRLRNFDRTISVRNWVESVAAVFVAIIYLLFAFHETHLLQRVGDVVVAAGAWWIVVYLFRYGKGPASVDPNQSLAGYTRTLVARYDHQIRLLKGVKYWYVLPIYVGFLIATVGAIADQTGWSNLSLRHPLGTQLPTLLFGLKALGRSDFRILAFVTIVFGLIWWVNESYGVGRLRRERARLLAMTGGAHVSGEHEA